MKKLILKNLAFLTVAISIMAALLVVATPMSFVSAVAMVVFIITTIFMANIMGAV